MTSAEFAELYKDERVVVNVWNGYAEHRHIGQVGIVRSFDGHERVIVEFIPPLDDVPYAGKDLRYLLPDGLMPLIKKKSQPLPLPG